MYHRDREQGPGDGSAFGRLVHWEFRHLIGQRWGSWYLVWGLATIAIGSTAWWAASRPDQENGVGGSLHNVAMAWLLATPLRDPIVQLAQLSFGYMLLRIAVDFAIAFARLSLPAVAAGTVVNDLRTGRLEELQLTGLSAIEVYVSKCLAAALVFLGPGLLLLVLLMGVLVAEAASVAEVARLLVELVGGVLLTASVTVTCSSLSRSAGAATLKACALLWLVYPLFWLPLCFLVDGTWAMFSGRYSYMSRRDVPAIVIDRLRSGPPGTAFDFRAACGVQAAFTGFACVVALLVGVRMIRRHGFGGGAGGLSPMISRCCSWLATGVRERNLRWRPAKTEDPNARPAGGAGV